MIRINLFQGEELLAVCKFCGYTSSDLDKCERCFRNLPLDAKLTTLKKTNAGNISKNEDSGNTTIDKRSFYKKVVNDQEMPWKNENSVKPTSAGPHGEMGSHDSLNVKGINSVIKGKPGRKPAQNKMKTIKPRVKKSKSLVPGEIQFQFCYLVVNCMVLCSIASLYLWEILIFGAGRSSEVERSLMVQWVVGLILHGVDPLSYFSFQPVLHDWCNKGRGMCYPVCGMVHIKEPLLLIDKSSLCGGSGLSFSLSEWSLTICLTPYNHK